MFFRGDVLCKVAAPRIFWACKVRRKPRACTWAFGEMSPWRGVARDGLWDPI